MSRVFPVIPRSTHAGSSILDGISALPGTKACNAILVALTEKKDVTPEELELLSHQLGRLSWERARAQTERDLP